MKKNINLEIGERVRSVRTSRGFSREELAEIIDISTLFLGYIECGQRGMSIDTLQKMCKSLNVSADYILFGKEVAEDYAEKIVDAVQELDTSYYPLALESINNLKRLIALIESKSKN